MIWHQTHHNRLKSTTCEVIVQPDGSCVSVGPFGRAQGDTLLDALGRCERNESQYVDIPAAPKSPYRWEGRDLIYEDANGWHYAGRRED